jgi:hypothetical protein
LTFDEGANPSASEPDTLFSTGGIDPASGLSWTD